MLGLLAPETSSSLSSFLISTPGQGHEPAGQGHRGTHVSGASSPSKPYLNAAQTGLYVGEKVGAPRERKSTRVQKSRDSINRDPPTCDLRGRSGGSRSSSRRGAMPPLSTAQNVKCQSSKGIKNLRISSCFQYKFRQTGHRAAQICPRVGLEAEALSRRLVKRAVEQRMPQAQAQSSA